MFEIVLDDGGMNLLSSSMLRWIRPQLPSGGSSRWRKAIDRAAARRLFLGNERLSAQEAMEVGLVDRVAESFDDELRRLETLDPTTTRLLKELSVHADALSRSELMLLAERLGALYQ